MSARLAPRWRASPNFDDRPADAPIDMIVLHYTGMRDAASALDRLCDPVAAVSSHYVVEEDGTLWQLVEETRRAYHAGVSFWRGRSGLNAFSIGIEIVNPGHAFGYRAFPAAQMRVVAALCRAIQARHPIAARNVVGHSDIAPNRKQDPGELFDWAFLAAQGIGLWPEIAHPSSAEADLTALLGEIGYDTSLDGCIAAFQRHFRPTLVTGVADEETTAWASALAALIRDA